MSQRLSWYCPLSRINKSQYHWINIDNGTKRVGKIRVKIQDNTFIIYSIAIFPEYQGQGFAKSTLSMIQGAFASIVADRVRPGAVGFWTRMGFTPEEDGNFLFRQDVVSPAEPYKGISQAN